jgi:hypothetical protein
MADPLSDKLEKAFEHLLDRVLGGGTEMSVAEETSALTACARYLQLIEKLNPSNGEGGFNGYAGTATKFALARRGGGGSAPSDGGTIDSEPNAF